MAKFIKFIPLYYERIWGGRTFETHFKRKIPARINVGESWEIVDRDDAQSVVANGKFKGLTISKLIKKAPAYIMGKNWNPNSPFPVMVKWLDCREALSVQVHPSESSAKKYKGQTKTENWYVAKCKKDAPIYAGFRKPTNRKDFENAVKQNKADKFLNLLKVKEGDSVFVPSGRVHALGGGNLILEIQQNSDTTYRVYDWGRLGTDGKPRQLHLKESLDSIDFTDSSASAISTKDSDFALLCTAKEFSLFKLNLTKGKSFTLSKGTAKIVSLVKGEIKESSSSVKESENVLIPAEEDVTFKAVRNTEMLITIM